MPKETLQDKVLAILKDTGDKGTHLVELYQRFPDHLPQSVRGTVLSLLKRGKLVRVNKGHYKAT